MPERHISKPRLEKLLKADAAASSNIGEERQRIGDLLTKAETEDHLNKWAYGIAKKLNKMDAAKAALNIRALLLYIDLLGLAAQTDIEDAIDDDKVLDLDDHRPQTEH